MKSLKLVLSLALCLLMVLPATVSLGEEKPVVLTFYSKYASGTIEDSPWYEEYMLEKFNVKFDVTMNVGGMEDGIMNTMLASGELTDIIGLRTDADFQQAMTGGMLLDLSQYKEQLPAIFENPVYEPAVKLCTSLSEDGGLYALNTLVGEAGGLNITPVIRWDLYKKLGYPKVTNDDEFLAMMADMQALARQEEGKENAYAFQLWTDWDGYYPEMVANYWGYFNNWIPGYLDGFCWCYPDAQTEPVTMFDENGPMEYALRFLNKAYRMGLIDPDSAFQTLEDVTAKQANGLGLFHSWDLTFGDKDADDWWGFEPYEAEHWTIMKASPRAAGYLWRLGISSKCKDVDKALEVLNWFYSKEGYDLLLNGPEGYFWEYTEDGVTRTYTDNYVTFATTGEYPQYNGKEYLPATQMWGTTAKGGFDIDEASGQMEGLSNTPGYFVAPASKCTADWQSVYGCENLLAYANSGKFANVTYFSAVYTSLPTMPDEIKTLQSSIGEVFRPLCYKAIFAESDEEFDQYWEQAKADALEMGAQTVIDNARERFAQGKANFEMFGMK